MRRNKSDITVTDQFCGAGGSSQGVRTQAGKSFGSGIKLILALNHWKLAIDTHQTNFPDTDHHCTDIQACDPRYYPTTDILITSPECTNHSLAKGKNMVKQTLDLFDKGILDPSAERSRATMWDVCRFAEYHQYRAIIVENVVDARKWVMWDAWLQAMHSMGYNHKCVYINSMHCHPTPQSRDRMYVVFWKKGQRAPKLEFAPKAYCISCASDVQAVQTWKKNIKAFGKFKTQYYYTCPVHMTIVEPYYYAAFNAIDWSDIGKRIGDRIKPLSENTTRRIQYGLDLYGMDPMVVSVRYSSGTHIKPLFSSPLPTQPTQVSEGIITPFIIKGEHMSPTKVLGYVKPVTGPFQTQTVRQSMSIVTPFITELNRTGKSRKVQEAISTVLANGNHHGLAIPFVVNNKGKSMSKPATEPLASQTTKGHLGIVTPEAWNSFIHYNRSQQVTGIHEPIQTIATIEQDSLVSYQKPRIEDCYYRMLKPHEITGFKLFICFKV